MSSAELDKTPHRPVTCRRLAPERTGEHQPGESRERAPLSSCLNGTEACGQRGSQQRLVKRRDGQFVTISQFKVCGVVTGELVLTGQRPYTYEHLRPARIFHFDGQVGETFEKDECFLSRNTALSGRQFDHIDHFVQPQDRHDRAIGQIREAAQQRSREFCRFLGEAPRHRYSVIEYKPAHGRPSSISSLIVRPPSVSPLLNSRIRAPAASARCLSKTGSVSGAKDWSARRMTSSASMNAPL